MRLSHLHRHLLALALAVALAAPAHAQQVVADGDEQTPAPGDYATTDPVHPGNTAGHAFLAINGGRIIPAGVVNLRTEGMYASAARVEGAGSRIELQQGSIITTGYGAAGLSAGDGGQVHANGTRIETFNTTSSAAEALNGHLALQGVHLATHGAISHGVSVRGGTAHVADSVIAIHGTQSHGLQVHGGRLVAERTRIDIHASGDGVSVMDDGEVHLRSVQIHGHAAGAGGVQVGPGRVVMEDVDIHLSHAGSGSGLSVAGDVVMRGGSIRAAGERRTAVQFATTGGGTVQLQGVDLSAVYGIFMMEGSLLTMQGSRLESLKTGININAHHGVARVVGSSITTRERGGNGILMMGNGELDLQVSQVMTEGMDAPAVSLIDGTARIADTRLHTLGDSSNGLNVDGGTGSSPRAAVSSADVLTEGRGATGVVARRGGTVEMAGSVVRTAGDNAHGVMASGSGEVKLDNTVVFTGGEGSWAAIISNDGRLQIDGGALVSARQGGVWVRSSRDPHLSLGNGAIVSGGNGIALALDAAVAGRFDVVLEGGSQLLGDIVTSQDDEAAGLVPQSQVHARLAGGSLWQGRSSLLHSLALEDGSHWQLSGDARVGGLQVRDSVVSLSNGHAGGFNTLTVDGDLHSEAATFVFNGALAGDNSAIDRLHVRGDATGDAQIRVNNIGGMGGPTADGIALIQIDGASRATYALAGRAVGGAHEYFLFQGSRSDPADGHWYLRSELRGHCELDPTAPGCGADPDPDPIEGEVGPPYPPPLLRPEAGAYLANQAAALGMFAHGVHDRRGALPGRDERMAWARVARTAPDARAMGGQVRMRGSATALQLGSDLVRQGNTAVGVMLGSGSADSSAQSQLTHYSARGRVRGSAVGAYATWVQGGDGLHGAYLDSSLQRGRFHNRVQGIGLQREHHASRTTVASLEGGYTLAAWQGQTASIHLQPGAQLTHLRYHAGRHVESNGTVVDNAVAGGLQSRVGLRAFGRHVQPGRVLQPHVAVNWLRSPRMHALDFNGARESADLPRNRYHLQAGADLALHGRWGMWGSLDLQRGSQGYRERAVTMGMRRAW